MPFVTNYTKFGDIDKHGLRIAYPRDYGFAHLNLQYEEIPEKSYYMLVEAYRLEQVLHHNKIMSVVDIIESRQGQLEDTYMALYQHDLKYYLVFITEKEED